MKSSGNKRPQYRKVRRKKSRNKLFPTIIIVLLAGLAVVTVSFAYNYLSDKSKPSNEENTSKTSSESVTPKATPTATPEPTPELAENFSASSTIIKPLENPIPFEHNELRALYIGSAANLDANISIAKNSDINAFVVDIKESNGVYFETKNKLANEIGAVSSNYSIDTLMSKAKANNIKIIGRIVCFKDYDLAKARPDLCLQDKDGNLIHYPMEGNNLFINPAKTEVWEYIVDIAKEAIELGFDEIQFDYVRFPVCDKKIRMKEYFPDNEDIAFFNEDGDYNYENGYKYQCINTFLKYAKREIQDKLGVPLSIDVFGSAMVYRGYMQDGYLIGQEWESINQLGIDTVSPMIYPSHYALGTIMNGKRYANPGLDTYSFLKDMYIQSGFDKIDNPSHQRPYIDYRSKYQLTKEQISGQIDALAAQGIKEYIYWNPNGKYDPNLIR